MISKNIPNKLSRRNWLRGVAITATGAVVLPSFLTGCTDSDYVLPDFGSPLPPTVPLTNFQLRSAAANLLRMDAWLNDVQVKNHEYEEAVYKLLKGNPKEPPTDWKEIIIDVFTEIGKGILEVVEVVEEVELPFVGPALAVGAEAIKQWHFEHESNTSLDSKFGTFQLGYDAMHTAISDKLLTLADATDNYRNLREGWKDFEFLGKKYTLLDLAGAHFPSNEQDINRGTEYVALRTAATERFKRYLWNAMIIKAGEMESRGTYWGEERPNTGGAGGWARREFYSDPRYAGAYLRGFYDHTFDHYYFRYWEITIDDVPLSADVAAQLFIDDTPGNIINSKGLFPRDYVFKQFHKEKPEFLPAGYFDFSKDLFLHHDPYLDFDESADNYVFTGGEFSELTNLE